MSTLYQKLLTIACLTLFLAGCAGPSVDWDYNPSVNMTAWHTYAWLPKANNTPHEGYPWDGLMVQRIHTAVNQNLQAKGFRQVAPNEADFLINTVTQTKTRRAQDQITTSTDYGFSPWGMGVRTETRHYEYDEGILNIDIIDPVHHTLLWRGRSISRTLLNKGAPQERTNAVNSAVTAILKAFPPPQQVLAPAKTP